MYWWNSEHKVAVIEIPKNASTSFGENFKGWPRLHNSELIKQEEAEEIIVVFRDPYERFLSALNQYMDISNWIEGTDISKDRFNISPEIMFPWFIPNHNDISQSKFNDVDVHFLPQHPDVQHRFYKKYPEKYTFFWMTKDVVLDVQTYLWNKYKILPPRYGRIAENVGGIKVIKEVDKNVVENTYKKDYEFFEHVRRKHGWENK